MTSEETQYFFVMLFIHRFIIRASFLCIYSFILSLDLYHFKSEISFLALLCPFY